MSADERKARFAKLLATFLPAALALAPAATPFPARAADAPKAVTLLNVSYDPTRELYEEVNAAEFLYGEAGQEVAARNFYRPRDAKVAARHAATFPAVKLFDIDEAFGGWTRAQLTHFSDGGLFDQIYKPGT